LNDPFEFLAIEVEDEDFRTAFMTGREKAIGENGLVCFSQNWNSPLQWAHYAENHKGLCLGFDVPDRHTKKVEYIEERFPMDFEMNQDLVERLLTTKYAGWSYEQEYRAFVPLKEAEGKNYFINFGPELDLKEIFVGANSSCTRATLKRSVGKLANSVLAYKVRPSHTKFEIVKATAEAMW
tara:strand:+ start:140 stop:682 length:543 start_codon:yes stop_codon:yes gene_type:complete